MTNSERAAYIRGLMEGLELDQNSKEVKVLNAMVELLDDLCLSVEEMEDAYAELSGQVDEIDEDLGDLEEEVYGEEECCCGCHEDPDDEDGCWYTITCPNCGETMELSEDFLEKEDTMDCPNCGEHLEFEFDESEDEDENGEEAPEE